MSGDLDALRARSDALADTLAADDALAVNAAILELEPADVKATKRLGAGLMLLGRAKDALDVYETGFRVHPADPIVRKRVAQARHAIAVGSKASSSGQRATPPARGLGPDGLTGQLYW